MPSTRSQTFQTAERLHYVKLRPGNIILIKGLVRLSWVQIPELVPICTKLLPRRVDILQRYTTYR